MAKGCTDLDVFLRVVVRGDAITVHAEHISEDATRHVRIGTFYSEAP